MIIFMYRCYIEFKKGIIEFPKIYLNKVKELPKIYLNKVKELPKIYLNKVKEIAKVSIKRYQSEIKTNNLNAPP